MFQCEYTIFCCVLHLCQIHGKLPVMTQRHQWWCQYKHWNVCITGQGHTVDKGCWTSNNIYCYKMKSFVTTHIPAHVQHDITFTVQGCTVVPKAMSTSCPLVYTIVTSQCVHTKLNSLDTVVLVFCTFFYVWNKQQNAAMQSVNLKLCTWF